tara:strand:- start:74 stop:388 length:315 start_codon:yes stop_codon:yes gene_type:complete
MLNKKEYTIQTTFYTEGVLVRSTKDIIPVEKEVSKLVRDIKMKISELRKLNVKKDENVKFHPDRTYSYKVVNDLKLKPTQPYLVERIKKLKDREIPSIYENGRK